MHVNPELQRNVWLEVNTHRLVVMPLVLGLIFAAIHLTTDGHAFTVVNSVFITLFLALTGLWGAKRAVEAVSDEVTERTWDNQRMSVISPWSMTWGKLLGVTLYPWYGGVICLLVWLLTAVGNLAPDFLWKMPVLLVLLGVFMQATAFAAGVLLVRKRVQLGPRRSHLLVLFLAIAVIFAAPFSAQLFSDPGRSVIWYDTRYALLDFSIATLLLWGGWALAGGYRVMRLELQFSNGPWVWWGFLGVLVVYVSGFIPPWDELAMTSGPPLRVLLSFSVVLTVAYFMLLTESKDPVALRLAADAIRQQHWQVLLRILPCWALSLPVVVLLAGYLLIQLPEAASPILAPWFAFSLCLFFVRDAGLFVFLNMAGSNRHADTAAIIYLSILYAFIPVVLLNLSGNSWLVNFFLPIPSASLAQALIPPAMEIGLLFILLRPKFRIP